MARTPKPSGKLPDKGKQPGRRPNDAYPERLRFLIVCEGEKTEKCYFEQFRLNLRTHSIRVKGKGKDALSVVKAALLMKEVENYDQIWCVFDRDDWPAEHFNAAIELARENGARVAYSNRSFELWYLLHFRYSTAPVIHTEEYIEELSRLLGFCYDKATPTMYGQLLTYQSDAIHNAERLLEVYGAEHNPERDNPCTTVHLLVQELNRHMH